MASHHRAPVRSRRYELLGAALVAVIAALAVWAHHSMSTTRSTPSNPATTLPASAATVAPLPSPPQRDQLRAWRDQAKPAIDVLLVAGDAAVTIAEQGDMAGVRTACQATADALTNARQLPPSPDPALNTALQQGFTDYQTGIRHCISGTQKQDAIGIGQGAGFISQGKSDVLKAYDILEADLSPDSDVLTV
jgi:hypothetical protein